ncbi:alpha/beta hydrolase-fold protein [Winogradskyella maritima]|uniref:Alpha/beta hydrolase n=1 Tax=Winogradskyella maritima TaxID=1517766 RepID=A0ABV8AGK8_9FLAO|nr:alpha/beta hydrolase-fold protein [Winogradskyella maritima]
MKRLNLICLFLLSTIITFAQAKYETIYSNALGEDREIKVLLPRGYDPNEEKAYPVIYVFDGDYLFEAVAGNVDYFAYWEDIPESIVVGVNQYDTREDDLYYSEQNSLPVESGAAFFEFVGKDLIPHIQKNYKTENFRVAVGHGQTANFINYYLLRKPPIFNAYISVSPDLAPEMQNYLLERMKAFENKVFYYMATSTQDVLEIKEATESLDKGISAIENNNLLYTFDLFEGPSHYALPTHAIPKALERIFFVFQPISKKEYTESILKLTTSPVEYLTQKYDLIKDLFGMDKQILVNDFKAIDAAIRKNEKWEYYEDLSKIARKQYPDTLLGHYYLGMFYEKTGEPKKAMKTYRSAYILEEIAGISKDLLLEKADEIKADFGY